MECLWKPGINSLLFFFFDEIDSLVSRRGIRSDGSGVNDRLVSQFGVELDRIQMNALKILVIGATNRIDLIDECLVREGRFEIFLLIDAPRTHSIRLAILKANCKDLALSTKVDLEEIERYCPMEMSPADLGGLCQSAGMEAAKRVILMGGECKILKEDFRMALGKDCNF